MEYLRDTFDKNGNKLLETQVKVALPNDVNSKKKGAEDFDRTIFNECIPTKNHTMCILTLYHTTNTVLIQGNKKQMWVDKEYPILRTVLKRMKEKDLTILDAYNQVLDLPNKDDHHHTTMSIPLSETNKENIQPNQVPTAIRVPQIVITPPEPDKTEQEVALETTTTTKASVEIIPETNEIESKHNTTSQEDIVLMEMEDMSGKTEDIKERALPKSQSKQKSSTTKKKMTNKCNNANMVTLDMHNNLKNTINKMEDEITQFAERYEEEQANIATEISKIVEALIAPIASENIKLKEELNDANLKIEQLRSQILGITTQNRNKIKESKNWTSSELETINNSIAALDTGLKGLTSLQMQTIVKTKTGNNSKSSTNTKASQHESPPTPSRPPSSTPPPPPKPSLTPSQ